VEADPTDVDDPRSRGGVMPGSLLFGWALPSFLYALLALSKIVKAFEDQRFGERLFLLLSAALWIMFLVFMQRRRAPLRRSRSAGSVAAALGAAIAGGLFGFTGVSSGAGRLLVADVFLAAGLGFSLYAAAYLGRCFGVMADARGLVTDGPYRLVRHPLYLGELVTMIGMVIGARRVLLAIVGWCVIVALQIVRARFEEQTITAAFPDYATYMERVPHRILPGLY
jgi:protein-S-isoprenylcysteine O-methyltransferase Ste14